MAVRRIKRRLDQKLHGRRTPNEGSLVAEMEAKCQRSGNENRLWHEPHREAGCASNGGIQFLAQMSHEIRTPLTAILGFSEHLLDWHAKDCEYGETVRLILKNCDHLKRLINDILDFSRMEAGHLPIEYTEIDPSKEIEDSVSLLRNEADRKGIDLRLQGLEALPPMITTDVTRFRQILFNLILNALKFTLKGSVVIRSAWEKVEEQAFLQVEVQDTGIGIDADEMALIFDPFRQAEASTPRQFGGSGLGLAISRQLARKLGGDVVLTQSAKGQGSTFRATISTARCDVRLPSRSSREDFWSSSPLMEAQPATSLSDACILLAEDNEDGQRLVAGILTRAGAKVTIVGDGLAATDAALDAKQNGRPFDMILMDMQMPQLNGYDAARRLRGHGYHGVILALTACAMHGDKEQCLLAGCNDYVAKPIDRRQFLAILGAHLPQRSSVVLTPSPTI